ncbi:MAG: response regulator, partial [Acidobacteriota bacterium]
KVVELTFSDSEYELLCVSNGQRALEKVAEEMPDLILADVVMPEKNGYEVCEAIKANPATARVPVILLSGTFEPFDRERAERLGCDAIVSKPFDSQQLLRQVEAVLARAPQDIPMNSTLAIPIMAAAPPPPPPAVPERLAEAGFSAEDFTGTIRTAPAISGGPDLFEEEYGQADVETAIAAFEKAHPEFTHADDDATAAALEETVAVSPPRNEDSLQGRQGLAGWLREEPERPPSAPPQQLVPTPFWVPREPEPDLQPIPFGGDDSGSRHSTAATPVRADEAPTQQIPLAAEFASLSRRLAVDADRDTDETRADVPLSPAAMSSPAAPEAHQEDEARQEPLSEEPSTDAPVSREIEVLAQTTSIGQLKEMLSSVSRHEGGLSEDDIDRLASRVVERLSEKIVREIAWEVIPDVAEILIKKRIKELEADAE